MSFKCVFCSNMVKATNIGANEFYCRKHDKYYLRYDLYESGVDLIIFENSQFKINIQLFTKTLFKVWKADRIQIMHIMIPFIPIKENTKLEDYINKINKLMVFQ